MRRDTDGRPFINHITSSGLGVRSDLDIDVDAEGFVDPGSEGMTVCPESPERLPHSRRPESLGGIGKHPAWELDTADLPDTLTYAEEGPDHGYVEPAYRMPFSDYQLEIEGTRDLWREVN